jgi:hypothetical protein
VGREKNKKGVESRNVRPTRVLTTRVLRVAMLEACRGTNEEEEGGPARVADSSSKAETDETRRDAADGERDETRRGVMEGGKAR